MRDTRGFAFVEILIALIIASFVVTTAFFLCLSFYRSYIHERDRIEVQENLRIAVSRMANKLRAARLDTVIPENIDEVPASRIEFLLSPSGKSAGYRLNKNAGESSGEIEEKVEGASGFTWLPITSGVVTSLFFVVDGDRIKITIEGEKGKSGKVKLFTEFKLWVGENG